MSYCRRGGDSDVYLIKDAGGKWICYCGEGEEWGVYFGSEEEVLEHLRGHISRGDKVPDHAISRLEREIASRGH